MAEEKPGPDSPSAAYKAMCPRWEVINCLLGGTEAMRAAGTKFMPQHPEESDKRYFERLECNVLLNMTELTLDSLAGQPFREAINTSDDVPPAIEEVIFPDVDLQGNNLDVFCRQWFRDGLGKAFSHVLVEFPRVQPKEDGKARTLEDDRKENLRPYWVHIPPENVIFAYAEMINGVETLLQVRIMESVTSLSADGWEEVCIPQIRVLTPGLVRLFQKQKVKGGKEQWVEVEQWPTGLTYIPFVTFYADREDFMFGKPPLLDLAYLNVAHWQSSSDQRSVLTVARFPMLAASGVDMDDPGTKIVVGPYQLLASPAAEGKFYYVEHGGAAIDSGQKDLEALEKRMSAYGGQFLVERSGNATATARALDSAESSSDLQSIVLVFQDAVAQVIQITSDWMKLGTDNAGTVDLFKDYSVAEMDAAGLTSLEAARTRKDLSRKAYLNELQRRKILDEEFDQEEDATLLEEETAAAIEQGMAMLDLDPTQKEPTAPTNEPAKPQNQPPAQE